MSNILVVGDTHGDLGFIQKMVNFAKENDCTEIIQLGDFGLWPIRRCPTILDTGFLQAVISMLDRADIKMTFIDGNHDAHKLGREASDKKYNGTREFSPNLIWADRGSFFYIDGIKFGALGGAISIDRDYRRIDVSWWETETTTIRQVDLLAARCEYHVDVLLTHDAPFGVEIPGIYPIGGPLGREMVANRKRLSLAVERVKPKWLWHGHYHIGHTSQIQGDVLTRVRGYASNIEDDSSSYGIWDTDSLDNPYENLFDYQENSK